MAFRFSLQKVLDYREQREEEAKTVVARIQSAVFAAESREQELNAALRASEERLYNGTMMETMERWLTEAYIKGLHADKRLIAGQLAELHRRMKEARRELTERAVEKKLLEKLKERQKQQYRENEAWKERKDNDETATLRYKAPDF